MKRSITIMVLLALLSLEAKQQSGTFTQTQKQQIVKAIDFNVWPGVKKYINADNINEPITSSGWTAFIYAAYKGQLALVKKLYALSPECLDGKTNQGGTAFMEAVRGGRKHVLKWFKTNNLLDRFINKKDNLGNTPAYQALYFKKITTLEWLLQNGAKVTKRLKDLAKGNSSKRVQALISKYEDTGAKAGAEVVSRVADKDA